MKITLTALILIVAANSFAEDLSLLYEKAYFLETAKGQTEEALEIYEKIVATSAPGENRQTIIQSLERMLVLHKCQRDQTLQSKVDNFEIHPDIVDHVIDTFGKPSTYLCLNTKQ